MEKIYVTNCTEKFKLVVKLLKMPWENLPFIILITWEGAGVFSFCGWEVPIGA